MKTLLRFIYPKLKERVLDAIGADPTSAQGRKRMHTTLLGLGFALSAMFLLCSLSFYTASVAKADDSIPLCEEGIEYDAGLCYVKCDDGYRGVGPVCWERCPEGYTDDGAFCRKDAIIEAKDIYGRGVGTPLTCSENEEYDAGLCYPKCPEGQTGIGPLCYKTCPDGFTDDGLLCRKDAEIINKESYGRGAGSTMTCASNEDWDGLLCYPKCDAGYSGAGPVCWQDCPSGYTDTGLFCRKNGTTFAKDFHAATQSCTSGYTNVAGVCWQQCPSGYVDTGALCEPHSFAKDTYVVFPAWESCNSGYTNVAGVCWQNCPANYTDGGTFCRYDGSTFAKDSHIATYSCGSGYTHVAGVCWQICPAGYTDTGAFCEPESIPQNSYVRGGGVGVHTCADGLEKDGLLCYTKCDAGYVGVGPVCWKSCPSGYTDDGALCRKDAIIFAKESSGRGVGGPIHTCAVDQEQDGALCYPTCDTGYSGVGPVCWENCPDGFTDDGALCRKDAIITAKDTYGRGAGIVPNCDINNLNCAQNFETANNFRPQPWGYGFENWGNDTYNDSTDFDAATLVRMFGSGVCLSGSTAQECVLKASAITWRQQQLASVKGGHCYGMAVSSQRFFAELDLTSSFQSGTAKTYDLDPTASVRANISEMARTQSLQPADGSDDGWIENRKPSEILNLIRTQLRDVPNDPYLLAFFANGNGHATTPFAIEDRGDGIFYLHMYDNNWPNKDRYLVFDTVNETWLYSFSATNPGEPVGAWSGNQGSISLRPTSAHPRSGWACQFCSSANVVNASGGQAVGEIEVSLAGEGRLTAINAEKKSVGWQQLTQKIVNQIPGAEFVPFISGSGLEENPMIRLPLSDTAPIDVIVSSTDITRVVNADLMVTGPQYAVGLTNMTITPGQTLSVTVRPDGRQLVFQATNSTQSPDIFFAGELSGDGNSYRFDLAGFNLSVGKIITVTLDTQTGQLLVSDNDTKENAYDLDVLRITSQGQEQNFQATDLNLSGENPSAINFEDWDGDNSMNITVDGQTTPVQNEFVPEESNNAPTANSQTVTVVAEQAKDFTLTGSDLDGNTLSFIVVTQPSHGTLSGTAPALTYTPTTGFVGADSFTFKVNDGIVDSEIESVTITVGASSTINNAPTANGQTVTVVTGQAKNFILTGSDLDGNTLSFIVVTQPSHGTLSGTAPALTYTPTTGFVGADSFTFKVNDGIVDSPTVAVTIDVTSEQPTDTAQRVFLPVVTR